jgi:hypothetical protein
MALFHFSDDGDVTVFKPRPVVVPLSRPASREWLNGPLVWAIDDWHQPMYLFPRECPRILLWPRLQTSAADRRLWWGGRTCRMRAFIEEPWLQRLGAGHLYRYELPDAPFESLGDAGMWVSRMAVKPNQVSRLDDLPGALKACDVDLCVMASLTPLREVWSTSLHASGIRLRNAEGWRD